MNQPSWQVLVDADSQSLHQVSKRWRAFIRPENNL